MNKRELKTLKAAAHLTPSKLRKENPELVGSVLDSLKSRVAEQALSRMPDMSESLANAVKGVKDIKVEQSLGEMVVESAYAAGEEEVIKEAKKAVEERGLETTVSEAAALDTPIGLHPAFLDQLAAAEIYELSQAVSLEEPLADQLVETGIRLPSLDETQLSSLVEEGRLDQPQAQQIANAASLYRVLDNRTEMVTAVQGMGGREIQQPRDLVGISRQEWKTMLQERQIQPPLGLSVDTYARGLEHKMANLYPTAALSQTLGQVDIDPMLERAAELEVLREFNPQYFPFEVQEFADLDTGNLSEERVASLRRQFEEVKETINRYPGLRLGEVLADDSLSRDEKWRTVKRRTQLVDSFFQRHAKQNIFSLDLSHGSEAIETLDFGDVGDDERRMILATAKSYQRSYALTDDLPDAEKLVAAGFDSSVAVAEADIETFSKKIDVETDALPDHLKKDYYKKAVERAAGVTAKAGIALENFRDLFNNFNVSNQSQEVETFLAEMPGYEDFFGNQDYCDCEHCRSILSPAAYFADLMGFIDDHVTKEKYFGSDPEKHPLSLKSRRPDLWNLELTCENTTGIVPYLDIINKVLENAIAQDDGLASNELQDRTKVREVVYQNALPATGGDQVDSFRQPLLLPFERFRIYLEHFDITLADIASALNASPAKKARAELALSHRDERLIVHENDALSFLRSVYGIDDLQEESHGEIVVPANGSGTEAPDAQLFLAATHLTRDEFGRIIETQYVIHQAAATLRIVGEKRSKESVQNDIERVYGLRRASLDRLHRFTRLWRAVPWTIEELDLVLAHLTAAGLSQGIDENQTLQAISRLLRLQQRLDVGVEELVALWHEIPVAPTDPEQRSLFDRVFNLETFLEMGQEPLPGASSEHDPFLHPAFRDSSSEGSEPMLRRLLAATSLGAEAFLNLIRGLKGPSALNFDPQAGNVADRKFPLNRKNLNLLYRHARLARLMGISPDVLFRLLQLDPEISDGHIASLAELETAVATIDWYLEMPWSIGELEYILGGARPDSLPDPTEVAQGIIDRVAQNESLIFAETIFSLAEGVTEAQSRAIIEKNANRFEEVKRAGGGEGETAVPRYRLAVDFDLSRALTLPAALDPSLEPKLRRALRPYHSVDLLPNLLTGPLGLSEGRLKVLVKMLGEDLGDVAYMKRLRGAGVQGTPLVDLIKRLLPLTIFFKGEDIFTEAVLTFISNNLGVFGISNIGQLDLAAAQSVDGYRRLHEELEEFDTEDLHRALTAFQPGSNFQSIAAETLGEILGVEGALVSSLLDRIDFGKEPVAALHQLRRAAELADKIGLGGEAMQNALSDQYKELADAASALVAAFRAKYDDEEEYQKKVRPFADRVRTRKRDGLVEFLLRSSRLHFDETSDLYAHYLLDVELDGCARTSPIVAANSSLQLYVQRVLLNLERADPESEDPVHVPPDAIPQDQWAWRKRYRVWEANRKVFLYPENYLEPGLRDNKTPLFEQLEEKLLSREINADSVRKAYAEYLRGFEEVANLTIAGAHHEKSGSEDVLHLFGATSDDPPQYYYRRVENAEAGVTETDKATYWAPWEKLEVQIPTKKVSPIVFQNRLYVFWTRYVTRPIQEFDNGKSKFKGYRHTMSVSYTKRRLDGTWVEPQEVKLEQEPFPSGDPGLIKDLLQDTGPLAGSPRYSPGTKHEEPREGYGLKDYPWERLYLWNFDGRLMLRGRDFRMWSLINLYEGQIEGRLDAIDWPGRDMVKTAGSDPSWPYIDPAKEAHFRILSECLGHGFDNGRILYGPRLSGSRFLLSSDGSKTKRILEDYVLRTIAVERPDYPVQALPGNLEQNFNFNWNYDRTVIAVLNPDATIEVVHGSPADAIINSGSQTFYLQESVEEDGKYLLRRLDTGIVRDIAQDLFSRGVDTMLATETQTGYGEPEVPFDLSKQQKMPLDKFNFDQQRIVDGTGTGEMNFTGSMGVYFREIFFHIPFLIADHLNSQQQYEEAREWYHKIFNPTAPETDEQGTSSSNNGKEERVWRYREFREHDVATLRDMLTDAAEVNRYKEDPFNPHAIARLRLTAYQKAVVMKYIDNLLDWGDDLFARDTRESVREATLLYTMASDILGPRPAELGDCGEGEGEGRSYEELEDEFENDSEFLPEIESFVIAGRRYDPDRLERRTSSVLDIISPAATRRLTMNSYMPAAADRDRWIDYGYEESNTGAPIRLGKTVEVDASLAVNATATDFVMGEKLGHRYKDAITRRDPVGKDLLSPEVGYSFGRSWTKQVSPVFCIPNNDELLGYWDRVADRLYKIRHCLNIEGEKRQLSLFAPPISPDMLVRARAAGLSLQEVMDAVSGNLPPYRFRYLVQKAKQYVGTLQNFGTSLMSAIEKRDAEELAQMRNTHQKNILNLTESIQEQEIEAAQKEIERLQKRKALVEYRSGYYDGLISSGLTSNEKRQKDLRVAAAVLRTAAGTFETLSAVIHLIPNVGAPTAITFGGRELGNSSRSWTGVMRMAAGVLETDASIAGLKANFNRREQRWKHQKKLAQKELETLDKQMRQAEIRQEIAIATLERHRQKQDHLDEIIDFYGDKFSNLGFYTWLANELQSLYRDAYNIAFGFVRLTARAYDFERNEYPDLNASPWDASHSGLLAGQRLMLDLERMEKQFIETNYRSLEMNQSFSLSQIDPAALIRLKETGDCDFQIPEFYFDLFYPGQYRRRIKAVRITIPCITGPYTNISAKLRLRNSYIRRAASYNLEENPYDLENPETAGLETIPPTRSTSISTSTAQGDAGVFNLDFQNERYMPFEGMGAISEWKLELPDPQVLPPFDYKSITDVILNISYTAEDEGDLREKVNNDLKKLFQKMAGSARTRIVSLRDEVSGAFHRLLDSPKETDIDFEISEKHFPMFLQGQSLKTTSATLLLDPEEGQSVGSFELAVNGTTISDFASGAYGELLSKDISSAISGDPRAKHTFRITDPGDLGTSGSRPALDEEKLNNILLVIEYKIPNPN